MVFMGRNTYQSDRRQRELRKKLKKEEKQQRKADRGATSSDSAVHIHADVERQILSFEFVGEVSAEEMQDKVEDLRHELEELRSGFVLFTDLSRLEVMENAGTDQIAIYMDLCAAKGVRRIVRLIPDPAKDVGFALLGVFHHEKGIPLVTCAEIEEARRALEE
jgi:hypothetical protein